MELLLNKVRLIQKRLLESTNLRLIKKYFKSEGYVYIFITQFRALVRNLESIDILLEKKQFEDSMTIFRKYIETFFLMLSIIENPELVSNYIIHNKYLAQRACNENTEEINSIIKSNPDNFIEYGYLKDIKERRKIKGRYSMRLVAKCANVLEFYEWYRLSSNFVHNNLTSLVYDETEGISKLKSWLSLSVSHLTNRIHDRIKL